MKRYNLRFNVAISILLSVLFSCGGVITSDFDETSPKEDSSSAYKSPEDISYPGRLIKLDILAFGRKILNKYPDVYEGDEKFINIRNHHSANDKALYLFLAYITGTLSLKDEAKWVAYVTNTFGTPTISSYFPAEYDALLLEIEDRIMYHKQKYVKGSYEGTIIPYQYPGEPHPSAEPTCWVTGIIEYRELGEDNSWIEIARETSTYRDIAKADFSVEAYVPKGRHAVKFGVEARCDSNVTDPCLQTTNIDLFGVDCFTPGSIDDPDNPLECVE